MKIKMKMKTLLILLLLLLLLLCPFIGISQNYNLNDQFYVIEEVSSQRNPEIWECSGYLEIKDSIVTFIYKYRNKINGIQGEIDGYSKKGSVQKFYVRGRGISSGSLISFIIRKEDKHKVVIRAYHKLSHFNLFFSSVKKY